MKFIGIEIYLLKILLQIWKKLLFFLTGVISQINNGYTCRKAMDTKHEF